MAVVWRRVNAQVHCIGCYEIRDKKPKSYTVSTPCLEQVQTHISSAEIQIWIPNSKFRERVDESGQLRADESGQLRADESGQLRADESSQLRADESGQLRADKSDFIPKSLYLLGF